MPLQKERNIQVAYCVRVVPGVGLCVLTLLDLHRLLHGGLLRLRLRLHRRLHRGLDRRWFLGRSLDPPLVAGQFNRLLLEGVRHEVEHGVLHPGFGRVRVGFEEVRFLCHGDVRWGGSVELGG